ncbi:HAMP domain-containing protein, partial [bacterium]|nr:HAMP domain-containing protein [bacterium]
VEKLKELLDIDWIEIIINGRQILYPHIPLIPITKTDLSQPIRLSLAGPLSTGAFFVHVRNQPEKKMVLVLARRAKPFPISLFRLWDGLGQLMGDSTGSSIQDLKDYEPEPAIHQIFSQGKCFRIRIENIMNSDLKLLVGYESEIGTLTRKNINTLMLQLATLEIIGLLVLGYFLGRSLFKPLEELKRGMERVSLGHWNEINENSKDEIGAVAKSFNQMIRELKFASKRLTEVQKELILKEKMALLGRFSAGVAHEINNPLSTILVSAGILQESIKTKTSVEIEDVEAIIDEARRCRKIVESLLRYARNKAPELKPCEFAFILNDSVSQVITSSGFPSVNVSVKPVPSLTILAEPNEIYQIMRNLLYNAKDAVSRVSNPQIFVEAEDFDERFVIVTVGDNGEGIEGIGEHLFEPFLTTKPTGTGLGLAICQSIIEGHGGRIWAERTKEGFTIFRFSLQKSLGPK